MRGEQTLSELQAELGSILATHPEAATEIGASVDELYRDGHLPLQVHRMLSGLVRRDETRVPIESSVQRDEGDATANDRTRRQPRSDWASGDASALAVPPEERTVIPAADVDSTR